MPVSATAYNHGNHHPDWLSGNFMTDSTHTISRRPKDINMHNLWKSFERWLIKQFPQATILATPFNDPPAESIDEYQAFLKKIGYSPLTQAAFGKSI